MKAKKLLATFLALCMVASMIPISSLSVYAASSTLGANRITANNSLVSKVDLTTAVWSSGTNTKPAGDGEGGSKVFDSSTATKAGVNFNGTEATLTFTTTEPTKITAYTLGTANDSSERDLKTWKFYGSNDGNTWTELDAVTNYTCTTERSVYIDDDFLIDVPAAFTHYKLSVTAFRNIGSGGYAQFSEFVISGYDTTNILPVVSQINALNVTDATPATLAAIDAVKNAYDGLSAQDKPFVSTSRITEAYNTYYKFHYNGIADQNGGKFAYLDFENGTGADALDRVTATIGSSVQVVDEGHVGSKSISITSTGSTNSMVGWKSDVYDPFLYSQNGTSISMWVNFSALPNDAIIFSYGYWGYRFFIGNTGGKLAISARNYNSTTSEFTLDVLPQVTNSQWTLLTVTCDASKNYRVYLNDKLVGGQALSFSLYDIASYGATSTIKSTTNPVYMSHYAIGCAPYFPDRANPTGKVDDFSIYNKALTNGQLALMFDDSLSATAVALIDEFDTLGTINYKSKQKLASLRATYEALSQTDKDALTSRGFAQWLANAETALTQVYTDYQTYVNAWTSSKTWTKTDGFDKVPWMRSGIIAEQGKTDTINAMGDEVMYQYKVNMKNIGFDNTKEIENWENLFIESEKKPNENLGNPWDHSGRQMAFLMATFPGISFSNNGYYAIKVDRNNPALGNSFTYNGRVYQQYWDAVASYNPTLVATLTPGAVGNKNVNVDYQNTSAYPGKSSAQPTAFRYAYAKYNQDNKWANKYLGLVSGDVVKSGTIEYQRFNSDIGVAYLITNSARNATITLNTNQVGYIDQVAAAAAYVVTGDLAVAIANDTAMFSRTGDLVSVSATEIVFTNGTLTAAGFAETDEAAATRVGNMIAALPDAANIDASHEAAIEAARGAYEVISQAAKDLITNYSHLTEAEEALADILAGPQDAIDVVNEIAAIGTVTYKSKAKIAAARAHYEVLSPESQAYVSNLNVLEAAEQSYQDVLDAFSYTITGTPPQNTKVPLKWIYNQTEDEWNATRAAAVDELKYQYSNGLNIGFINGGSKNSYTSWMDKYYYLEFTDKPNDNVEHPWDDGGRCWATVGFPFAGMAFSCAGYFAAGWEFENCPLSDSFEYNGKTYQVTWTQSRSYDTVAPYNYAPIPTMTNTNIYPGSGDYSAVIGNAFRYAYAKYNMDNKWNDKVLGVPDDNAKKASGDVYYQKFYGPIGDAYLLTTTGMAKIGTDIVIDDNTTAAVYQAALAQSSYTIVGDLAAAISNEADLFANCGNLISVSDTEIKFANATVTSTGVTWHYADYSAVDTALARVPADLSVYTDATAAAVTTAVNAVVRDKYASEQSVVSGYATAINNAVDALVKKSVEMHITISEGMVSENSTNAGKYDITWNAKILTGDGSTIESINDAGVTFKRYGVYYATGEEILEDYANASADEIRNKIFDSGEDIDVYTMFGFRLKGVTKDAVRAAMFYVEYEFEGHTYIILSSIDETIATISVD